MRYCVWSGSRETASRSSGTALSGSPARASASPSSYNWRARPVVERYELVRTVVAANNMTSAAPTSKACAVPFAIL